MSIGICKVKSSSNGNKERPVVKLQPYEFELFNRKLRENYGQLDTSLPYFRLVWSEDVFERRVMTHTDQGLPLTYPEVREVMKYRPQTRDRYILEGLQEIAPGMETDLLERISYEPVWTFMDRNGEYLIPRWDAIYLILETIKANQEGKRNEFLEEYIKGDREPEVNNLEQAIQMRQDRVSKLYYELFGEETKITDALAYGRGTVVPGPQEK